MDTYTVFRSVLIFLLLCYGKKFVDANERNQRGSVSNQSYGLNAQPFARRGESIPISQNSGFQQVSAPIRNVQQGSPGYTEIKINRKSHSKSTQVIVLNIDKRVSTNEVTYKLEHDGGHKFICKEGFLIGEVVKDATIVWRANNNAHAYGMIFFEDIQGRPVLRALIDDDGVQQHQPQHQQYPQHHQPTLQPQQAQHPQYQSQHQPMHHPQLHRPMQHPQQPMQQAQPHQPRHNVQQVFHNHDPELQEPVPSHDVGLDEIFVVERNDVGSPHSDDFEVRRGGPDTSYVSENFGLDADLSDMEFVHRSPKRRPASSGGSYSPDYGGGYLDINMGRSHHFEAAGSYQSGYDSFGEQPRRRRTRIPRPEKHGSIVSEVKNIMVLDVSIGDNECYTIQETHDSVVFKAKSNFLFNKIKNGNDVVWEPAKQGDYADGVKVKIGKNNKLSYDVFIREEPALEEDFEDVVIPVNVHKHQEPQSATHQQPPSNVYAPEVNILTLSSNGTLKINDESQYNLSRHNNILKYHFHSDAKCVEVKYLRETVWKAEQYFPLSVSFNRENKTFVVDFGTVYVHCVKHDNTWANVLHKYNAENEHLGVKYNQNYPRYVSNEVEPKRDVTAMAHKATAVVDIDTRKSANEFDFSKKSDDCGTYKPKHNFIFKVVKGSVSKIGGKVDIWHPDTEDEYVTKVVIDGVSFNAKVNNATLFLANGNIKHFTILNKNWVEVDPSVIVDVEKKTPTCEYDYYPDGKIDTFKAKGHFLFQGIKQTIGRTCNKAEVDIWETNDPLEYGTKVMAVTTKQSEKYVVMFLINNRYKLFYKSGKNSMWKDESDNASTVSNLKLLGIDVEDSSHYGFRNSHKKGTHVSALAVASEGVPNEGGDRQHVAHGTLDDNLRGDPTKMYIASNVKNMSQDYPGEYSSLQPGQSATPPQPKVTNTQRKVIVEHVSCDPNLLQHGSQSDASYRETGTSTSEDSDYENHSGHSDWINLRRMPNQ